MEEKPQWHRSFKLLVDHVNQDASLKKKAERLIEERRATEAGRQVALAGTWGYTISLGFLLLSLASLVPFRVVVATTFDGLLCWALSLF